MRAVLAIVFLVASLIGSGVDAVASLIETDDVERAPVVEVLLVEERRADDDDAIRLARRLPATECRSVTSAYSSSGSAPADSQVLSRLRNSGIQRATHPTGPPAVLA
ncbi:MAG: hypothetical protein ACM30I_01985 [Gemmatimonas sp.]